MNIKTLTVTGADNNTKGWELAEIRDAFPFVEFGILLSNSKAGGKRYPTREYIEKEFAPKNQDHFNLSAHFCGQFSRDVLEGQHFDLIDGLHPSFKRVQLNYRFDAGKRFDLFQLKNYATTCKRDIILQYNRANKVALDEFMRVFGFPSNVQLLWDDSGGYGKEITDIKSPFKDIYTGYAGGINFDNVERICKKLIDMPEDADVWIDLESSVRDEDDNFDIDRVYNICAKVSNIRYRNNKFQVRIRTSAGSFYMYDVNAEDVHYAEKKALKSCMRETVLPMDQLSIDKTTQFTFNE